MTRTARLTAIAAVTGLAVGAPLVAQTDLGAKVGQRLGQVYQFVGFSGASGSKPTCRSGHATSNPACPSPHRAIQAPGTAAKWPVTVGADLDGREYQVVKPWLYGLEPAPRGSRYAVIGGVLVRIDSATAEVLNVIRTVRPTSR